MEDVIVIVDNELGIESTPSVGAFTSFAMPLVRRYNYAQLAKDLLTIEPLPQGAISYYAKNLGVGNFVITDIEDDKEE